MNRSFAQFPRTRHATTRSVSRWLLPVTAACLIGGCASLPPPTAELAEAQQSVSRANDADADQYAPDAIAQARSELAQAQAALSGGHDSDARAAATATTTDAQYAYAVSDAAKARADYTQQRTELLGLGQRLNLQADAPAQSPLDEIPAAAPAVVPEKGRTIDPAAAPTARLQALDADPQLNGFAAYERLRAHQALDALVAAHGRDREGLLRTAERRVDIAELAARTGSTRQATDRMQRQHSQWLVEASRQEAERARQEAERLRVQAQVQAEEAQRLQAQADADAAARQQAEDVIDTVGADEAAKLKAARDKQAALARQEAELLAQGHGASKAQPAATTKSAKSSKLSKKKKGK